MVMSRSIARESMRTPSLRTVARISGTASASAAGSWVQIGQDEPAHGWPPSLRRPSSGCTDAFFARFANGIQYGACWNG